MDGGKCLMGVATAMEEEQLAAQRQTHLSCPIEARYCCPAREAVVKVYHVDAHVPKSWATEEHQNNQQVDQAAKTEESLVDSDSQYNGGFFIARWAHDTSEGRDTTYR